MAEEQAGSLVEQDHASTTPTGSTEDRHDSPSDPHSGPRETIALILLAVTAILVAYADKVHSDFMRERLDLLQQLAKPGS